MFNSILLPGIPYTIQVSTGDKANAETSAKVFVILYGGKNGEETSGKIWLPKGRFLKGRTDIFNVEVGQMLSPLSRIDIGHDNSGPGPGWYLDKVWKNPFSLLGVEGSQGLLGFLYKVWKSPFGFLGVEGTYSCLPGLLK